MATADVTLRGWRDDDAAAAAELTRRFFAPDPPWDEEVARAHLASDALRGGASVRVAVRDGQVVGVGGYLAAPPWLYLWPVMAEDGAVAGALLDALIAAGRGPDLERVRVSVRAIEPGKQAAVIARGFARSIDFIEVVRPTTAPARAAAVAPVELERRAGGAIDRSAMHATHDLTFAEIANTAPMSAADFAHMLDGPTAWPAATAGWFAADGTCAGFVIGLRHADHGVVEAIGVHPRWRRRGLAAVMLDHLLAAAIADGAAEVRAMIASSSTASLGLHAAAGFTERARKALWDLALPDPR